jgi:hypothetical protein
MAYPLLVLSLGVVQLGAKHMGISTFGFVCWCCPVRSQTYGHSILWTKVCLLYYLALLYWLLYCYFVTHTAATVLPLCCTTATVLPLCCRFLYYCHCTAPVPPLYRHCTATVLPHPSFRTFADERFLAKQPCIEPSLHILRNKHVIFRVYFACYSWPFSCLMVA